MFPSAANDDATGEELRELAGDYESGRVRGVIVTYVMDDGEVKYKLMGALAQTENLSQAMTVAGELRRRIEQLFFWRKQ